MTTFYLAIVVVLFILAVSDLVVGVSNDAVNFLNSAVGSKVSTYRNILIVAALGILVGCTFSSGMMEVARKGIFHPEYFYFDEIILLFLAVMVTDVILLDTFNTFGMPTSTTVSIVFELLGAAVAFSMFKILNEADALQMGEYINTSKALAIISGILLSVVVAFTVGALFQYLTRSFFSFDYKKRLKKGGSIWGGMAIAAITFFLLVKGSKGASFMTEEMKLAITSNAVEIILISFVVWTIVLQLLMTVFKQFNMMKLIVLVGTFALAMAFAGNDLVNFVGVPLAGYNSYELYAASGEGADTFLMEGLAGQVKTPTLLLLLAGAIMTITLWTSKKAKSVIKTSLDLGRQYEGGERFSSYMVSRGIVRIVSKSFSTLREIIPSRSRSFLATQFDEQPFLLEQDLKGKDAPVFDLVRAASTLVVASILISIGTSYKLPLSTTYVTFMVFMGTSLADGAWGRESAVYRVSGVLSVIGGWFFTAFSAFTAAFVIACIFYYGGTIAIVAVLFLTAFTIYRTHKLHRKKDKAETEAALDAKIQTLDRDTVLDNTAQNTEKYLGTFMETLSTALLQMKSEDRKALKQTFAESKKHTLTLENSRREANTLVESVGEDQFEMAHLYMLHTGYLCEIAEVVEEFVKACYLHISNSHKTFNASQVEDLNAVIQQLKAQTTAASLVYQKNQENAKEVLAEMDVFVELIRTTRQSHLTRIKRKEITNRNSLLFLNLLAELRNIGWFTSRIVRIYGVFADAKRKS
jgi:phosphate/sulfate permease